MDFKPPKNTPNIEVTYTCRFSTQFLEKWEASSDHDPAAVTDEFQFRTDHRWTLTQFIRSAMNITMMALYDVVCACQGHGQRQDILGIWSQKVSRRLMLLPATMASRLMFSILFPAPWLEARLQAKLNPLIVKFYIISAPLTKIRI